MKVIDLNQFITTYQPVTNDVFKDRNGFNVSFRYLRLLEDGSVRLLENNVNRLIESTDEKYAILFDTRDIASLIAHISEKRFWSLYRYEQNDISFYQIVAGYSNKLDTDYPSTLLGYIVTEIPFIYATLVVKGVMIE